MNKECNLQQDAQETKNDGNRGSSEGLNEVKGNFKLAERVFDHFFAKCTRFNVFQLIIVHYRKVLNSYETSHQSYSSARFVIPILQANYFTPATLRVHLELRMVNATVYILKPFLVTHIYLRHSIPCPTKLLLSYLTLFPYHLIMTWLSLARSF